MQLRSLLLIGAAVIGLAGILSAPAQANFVFTGAGTSGTFQGQASEPWVLNYQQTQTNNWGSPGVGNGTTPYLENVAAYGLDLTFFGIGPLDPAQIVIGNNASCGGSGDGGTTFCNAPFGNSGIWQAFLTGPTSISFRAQDLSQVLDPGENFFVNVFFTDSVAPTNFSFSGVWLTQFAPDPGGETPIPGALPLFATGLGIIGFVMHRRRNKAEATA